MRASFDTHIILAQLSVELPVPLKDTLLVPIVNQTITSIYIKRFLRNTLSNSVSYFRSYACIAKPIVYGLIINPIVYGLITKLIVYGLITKPIVYELNRHH